MTTTTTTDAQKLDYRPIRPVEDPEQYRMSIGEHLEELRWRLILALVGFVAVFLVCLYFGNEVVAYFCRPLLVTLQSRNLPPWMVDPELGGTFMVYIRISLVTAAAISAPWGVYQIWLFVAAGLYPHERRVVMRYAPLSIVLLVGGMTFVYFLVLPWTIEFFVDWTSNMPLPEVFKRVTIVPDTQPLTLPVYQGSPDLTTVPNGGMWIDAAAGRINVLVNGKLRSVAFAPQSLVVPQYNLKDYIDLVVMMLLMFGLAFQLPIVVAALLKIGIVEADMLRAGRRYVYFALLIVAAAITPGDVITATLALLVPLILLYEGGIILGTAGMKKDEPDATP
jgi:sec-independent protein translocase protein TatC